MIFTTPSWSRCHTSERFNERRQKDFLLLLLTGEQVELVQSKHFHSVPEGEASTLLCLLEYSSKLSTSILFHRGLQHYSGLLPCARVFLYFTSILFHSGRPSTRCLLVRPGHIRPEGTDHDVRPLWTMRRNWNLVHRELFPADSGQQWTTCNYTFSVFFPKAQFGRWSWFVNVVWVTRN